MCGPAAAFAVVSLVATAAGGIQQAKSQRAAGKAAMAEAEYSAAIDKNNQLRADYLAEDAIARGKIEESETRLRGRLLLGQMRTALAANGQIVDQDSAGALVVDQTATNELDAQTVRNNAAREAQEFRIRGQQYDQQSELTLLSGRNANASAKNKARGTLLATGGKVASSWYSFDRQGAFD